MKSREQRRTEATARNAAYAKLTPQEKLARLDRAGLRAKRQRAKLEALVGGSQQ